MSVKTYQRYEELHEKPKKIWVMIVSTTNKPATKGGGPKEIKYQILRINVVPKLCKTKVESSV